MPAKKKKLSLAKGKKEELPPKDHFSVVTEEALQEATKAFYPKNTMVNNKWAVKTFQSGSKPGRKSQVNHRNHTEKSFSLIMLRNYPIGSARMLKKRGKKMEMNIPLRLFIC